MEENKTKKVLLLVAILLLLGFGLIVVGLLVGGKDSVKTFLDEESQTSVINKFMHVSSKGIWIGPDSEKEIDGGEMVLAKAGDVKSISMDFSAGEFLIKESSTDDITLGVEGKLKVKTELKNGMLAIRTKQKKSFFNIGGMGKMTIYLPKQKYEEVKIDLGAGEIQLLTDIEASHLMVSVGAGNMEMMGICSEKITADVGAGNITINQVLAKELKMNVGMGDCKMESADIQKVKLSVGLGEADLCMVCEEENVSYKAECGMGELVVGSHKIEGNGKANEKATKEELCNLELECGMGELHVNFK